MIGASWPWLVCRAPLAEGGPVFAKAILRQAHRGKGTGLLPRTPPEGYVYPPDPRGKLGRTRLRPGPDPLRSAKRRRTLRVADAGRIALLGASDGGDAESLRRGKLPPATEPRLMEGETPSSRVPLPDTMHRWRRAAASSPRLRRHTPTAVLAGATP